MGNSPLLPKAKIWEDQYFTETAEPGRVSLVRAGEWISPSVFPSGRCGRRARSRFYSFTHLLGGFLLPIVGPAMLFLGGPFSPEPSGRSLGKAPWLLPA